MSADHQSVDLEEGAACLNGNRPRGEREEETRKEKYKRRCTKGFSLVKVCCIAHIGLLTALIYLLAETKVGVELTEKLLYGAAAYAFNGSKAEQAGASDGLLLLAQLLQNLTLSSAP